MAIIKVQSVQGIGPGPSLTAVAAGDLLTISIPYIIGSGNGSATPTILDSAGQSWISDNAPTPQGSSGAGWVGVAQFSLPNANAGTHSLTLSLTGVLSIACGLAEWSGMATSSVRDQTGVVGSTAFGTVTMTATVGGATAQASELVIAAMAIETNSGASAAISDPPTGLTSAVSLALNNAWQSSNFGYEAAYAILSTTGTPAAIWTWTGAGTTSHQGIITTYKAATAGGGGGGIAGGLGGGLDGGMTGGFA